MPISWFQISQLLYDVLSNLSILFKFHLFSNYKILTDLIIARIASPGSKIHSLEFLDGFFGIKHSRSFIGLFYGASDL